MDSGSLKGYGWGYDGDGKSDDSGSASGKSARLAGGFRYSGKGKFKVTLRVVSGSDPAATAAIGIAVEQDEPVADAGMDVFVYPNATVSLHGTGKDCLGDIVRTEWKIGTWPFRDSPPFDPSKSVYTDTVPFETESLTVTPMGNGAIRVNGDSVAS